MVKIVSQREEKEVDQQQAIKGEPEKLHRRTNERLKVQTVREGNEVVDEQQTMNNKPEKEHRGGLEVEG